MDKHGKYELRKPVPPQPMEEQKTQVENAFGLDDMLRWNHIKAGILFIRGPINEKVLESFRLNLDGIITQKDNVDIEINSCGGDLLVTLNIYDIIRLYIENGKKIDITASGLCASAAVIIIQSAIKRKATRNTWFMLHQPTWYHSDTLSEYTDLEIEVDMMRRLVDQVFGILSDRCGKSIEELDKMTRHTDVWLSAKEALEFGLIDYIL